MLISLLPPTSDIDSFRRWLLETLEMENLINDGHTFPIVFRGYVDGRPYMFQSGSWQKQEGLITIGFTPSSRGDNIPSQTRLQILIAAASYCHIVNEPEVTEALTRAFGRETLGGFRSMYQGLIFSSEPVQRMAIAPSGQIAIEFEASPGWFGPSGAIVEIDPTWAIVEDTAHNPAATATATPTVAVATDSPF